MANIKVQVIKKTIAIVSSAKTQNVTATSKKNIKTKI